MTKSTKILITACLYTFVVSSILIGLFVYLIQTAVKGTIETGSKIQKCQRETGKGAFECIN